MVSSVAESREDRRRIISTGDREVLVTTEEVMEEFGIARPTLYSLMKRDLFPKPIKVGASVRWIRSELDRYIERQKENREGE